MKSIYEAIRDSLTITDSNTTISREDFETHFKPTKERITFTFNGWDGNSYNGESRTARVYRSDLEGFEDMKFVKVGKSIHYIDEKKQVTEKATGRKHPGASWLIFVARKAK